MYQYVDDTIMFTCILCCSVAFFTTRCHQILCIGIKKMCVSFITHYWLKTIKPFKNCIHRFKRTPSFHVTLHGRVYSFPVIIQFSKTLNFSSRKFRSRYSQEEYWLPFSLQMSSFSISEQSNCFYFFILHVTAERECSQTEFELRGCCRGEENMPIFRSQSWQCGSLRDSRLSFIHTN